MENKVIEFVRQKDYKFIEDIDQGGTGKTVLLHDETINEYFVCKKYSPFFSEDKIKYYNNFLDEIKILHSLYHNNIVRVFNYYLYSEEFTGYILMEYIEGQKISDFIKDNPDKLNNVFIQTISGFMYLEQNNILHRDIRPENILITNEGTVKIIDFGFSHKMDFSTDFEKNISLNWRYSKPKEFDNEIYDYKTEIYFIGKLFEEIILQNNLVNFGFSSILNKMTEYNYELRTKSFTEIDRQIIETKKDLVEFDFAEKMIYKDFANELTSIVSKINSNANYVIVIENIIKALGVVYSNSMLEEYVQNYYKIISCFIIGDFRYFTNKTFRVSILFDFYNLLKNTSKDKQKIIINNIWQRFDTIERTYITEEELPF